MVTNFYSAKIVTTQVKIDTKYQNTRCMQLVKLLKISTYHPQIFVKISQKKFRLQQAFSLDTS